jgi:hypothetical protein
MKYISRFSFPLAALLVLTGCITIANSEAADAPRSGNKAVFAPIADTCLRRLS